MFNAFSTKIRLQAGKIARLFAFCLLVISSLPAEAGVMLPNCGGVSIASVDIQLETPIPLSGDERIVGVFANQSTGNAARVPSSTSLNISFAILPSPCDRNVANWVQSAPAEVSLAFTNPFLDGILRPPIA